MYHRDVVHLLWLLAPLSPAAATDPLVGDWAFVADGCAEARMVIEAAGRFEMRMAEGDQWRAISTGDWRREGGLIVTESAGGLERFAIELEDRQRVILVSRDAPVDREAGVGLLDLRRCPPY